jgi:acylglycerol lipase
VTLRRVESHFQGARDRLRLFRRSWLPERPTRVLALVHGFAEHSGRYEHVARWFAERGYAVHGYDHRGHGRSEGTRTHVERFDDYLDDLDRFLATVHAEHPDLPIFLVGHSMGGLIVAAFLADRRPDVAAAVTSGAALELGPDVTGIRLRLSRWMRRLAPRIRMKSPLDPSGLSRDESVVHGYLEDPHVYRSLTASLGAELLRAIDETSRRAFEVQVPVLMLHGEADPMCPVSGSRAFHEGLHIAGTRLQTYPGLRHEIFNEPEQEKVFEDIAGWVDEVHVR